MFSVSASYEALLEADVVWPTVVYELELDAGTLYYSSEELIWGGNSYTRLAVSQSPVVNTMGTRVPECRVTFSNIANTLREHVEPDDLISNRRMTVRLLLRDTATGLLDEDSVVLIKGFMRTPRRWTQESLEITVIGLSSGALALIPSRATTELCNVHQFKEPGECNYSGGLTTCDRTYAECTTRARTHEFQGFRGQINPQIIRLRYGRYLEPRFGLGPRANFDGYTTTDLGGGITAYYSTDTIGDAESLSDHSRFISVVLGRRLLDIDSNMIEEGSFSYSGDVNGRQFTARFYALGEGVFNAAKAWYSSGEPGSEVEESGVIGKTFGTYWRAGTIGLDSDESETAYLTDTTSGRVGETNPRAQNRDWMSIVNDPYSHTAYLVMIQESTTENSTDRMEAPSIDVEALTIQKYTNDDTPTTSGPPVFTTNPIWQATAVYLSPRFGAGRWVQDSDFNFQVTQPASLVCDSERTGPYCTVTETSTSTTYTVDSTKDFQRGMVVEVSDGSPDPSVVVRVISETQIELEDAYTVTEDIGTITAKLPRYSCNLVLDRPEKISGAVKKILAHCHGYITSDVEGRIELRVETTGSSVAEFKDTVYDPGYGIIEGSFEVLHPNEGRYKSATNRVFASFVDQDNITDDVRASEQDDIASYGSIPEKLSFDGVDNAHTARQLATTHLRLRRDRKNGARFTVGPAGVSIQCGDIITVTHGVPGWSGDEKRVIRTEKIGLGSKDDMLVRLTVEDYQSTPYADIAGEQREIAPGTPPTVTLSVDTAANGVIILTWSWDGTAPVRGWGVFKSTATHAGEPSLADRIYATRQYENGTWTMQRTYTYSAVDSEFNETLYFVVRANMPPYAPIVSNEVVIEPADGDPGDVGGSPFNMLFGGDFNDPYDWTSNEGPEVLISPNATSAIAGFDQGLTTDIAYSVDDDTGTHGYVILDGSDEDYNDYAQKYTFASSERTGKIRVIMGITEGASSASGFLQARYRIDDVDQGTWVYQTFTYKTDSGNKPFPKTTFESGTLAIDLADLEVRTQGYHSGAHAGPTQVNIFEVYFVSQGNRPYSSVGNSIGTVIGDGSYYGELSRPFPGRDPHAGEPVFTNGSEATSIIWFKRADDAVVCTENLEVLIRNNNASPDPEEWILITVDAGDVTDQWQPIWQYTLFDEEVSGDLEWVARTRDTAGMLIDTCGVFRGEHTWNFSPNRAEPSSEGNQTSLRDARAVRGPWTGSGSQKRAK